jgi:integrase
MSQPVSVGVMKRSGRKYFEAQWVDPVTGLKRTRSTGKIRRRDADRFAAVIEKELQDGTYHERSRLTWADFRERYELEVLSGQRVKTRENMGSTFNAIEKHINPANVEVIGPQQISQFAAALRKMGRAEPTIKKHLSCVRTLLNWAKRQRIIRQMPAIDMPKKAKTSKKAMKGRPVTGEEFDRMLEKVPVGLAVKNFDRKLTDYDRQRIEAFPADIVESWRHLLHGLWLSGLRLGEALRLSWDDRQYICVDFTGRRPMFLIRAEGQKNGNDEILPMAPEFAEFLLATPEDDRSGFVFAPKPTQHTGRRTDVNWVSRVVSRCGRAAGVKVDDVNGKAKYGSAHDLRRSFGERWATRVMPHILQQLMRHEDISTTMRYYIGRNAETTADALWEAVANTSANTDPVLVAPVERDKP